MDNACEEERSFNKTIHQKSHITENILTKLITSLAYGVKCKYSFLLNLIITVMYINIKVQFMLLIFLMLTFFQIYLEEKIYKY